MNIARDLQVQQLIYKAIHSGYICVLIKGFLIQILVFSENTLFSLLFVHIMAIKDEALTNTRNTATMRNVSRGRNTSCEKQQN